MPSADPPDRRRCHICQNRNEQRGRRVTGLNICGKATGRLGHIGAMKCTRHRDLHGAAASLFYEDVEGLQRIGRSGHNRLLWAVVVDWPAVLAGLFARPSTCAASSLMTARMPPGWRSAPAAISAARSHTSSKPARVSNAPKGERGDLAQRESRTGGRYHAALTQGGSRLPGRERTRTAACSRSARAPPWRRSGTARSSPGAPRRRCKHLGSRRRCFDEVDAHRGMLGTLAGKQKRYATHADAPFRTCSAPSTRSSTISRALWRSLTMPAICPHKNEPSS